MDLGGSTPNGLQRTSRKSQKIMPTHRQDYSMLIDLIQQETGLENEILNQDFSIEYIKKLTLLSLGELLHQQEKLGKKGPYLNILSLNIIFNIISNYLLMRITLCG